MTVFWILVPVFVAVGIYLIWYTRRRKRLLRTFADRHGLRVEPALEDEVQTTLDRCFGLEADGLVRTFGQLSSVVDAGPVRIFRTVELLDLNPHGRASNPHHPRIAALFSVPEGREEFFVMDPSGEVRTILPDAGAPAADVAAATRRALDACGARYPVSVTVASGHAVVYLIPPTGRDTQGDIDAIHCIARSLRTQLTTATGAAGTPPTAGSGRRPATKAAAPTGPGRAAPPG
ncbi:MAG: hypothetical protein ACOC5E_02275 [Acidobacteriota bacterium]